MMTKVDIGCEIGRGWAVFKENMVLLILASLVAMLVGVLSCFILMGPMLAGMFLIVQRLLKNDPEKPKVGDTFKGFEYFVDTFLCILAIGIIVGILAPMSVFVAASLSMAIYGVV